LRQHRQHRLRDRYLFNDPSKVGLSASRLVTAGSTDDTDGADGVFGICAHPDHSHTGTAFTREYDLNAQDPEKRLRSPQSQQWPFKPIILRRIAAGGGGHESRRVELL
jgi:hypothetical protein